MKKIWNDGFAIWGSRKSDSLEGSENSDKIYGLEGDDTIYGYGGREKIRAGLGDDTVFGGDGDDCIDGGEGDNKIIGGAGDDEIKTGSGNDRVYGGDGADSVRAGKGDDTVKSGAGDDWVSAGRGDDLVKAGAGNDVVLACSGDDFVFGGSGNDKLFGGAGWDTAQFSGSILDYTWCETDSGALKVKGSDGKDLLKDFEALRFDDFEFILDGGNAPLAVLRDATTTEENTAFSFAIDLYDFDGDPVTVVAVTTSRGTVSATEGLAPSVTSAMGSSEGIKIAFDPGTDFDYLAVGETTTETVHLVVTDSTGVCSTTCYEITVAGSNDAPTLAAGTLAATEDGPAVPLDLAALGDDIDSDDDGTTLTYTVTGQPAEGSASVSGTTLAFDPGSDFQDLGAGETRDVTVEITATDAHGATASNTVTVTVTGVNDAPVATDDIMPGSIDEDTVAMAFAPGVLFNDTDPEGDPLTVTAYDAVSANGAAVTVNPDGSVHYDPTGAFPLQALGAGESVVDTFSYTISDGNGGTDTATVSITVTGVNDAPVAVDDVFETDEDTVIDTTGGVSLLDNDSDPDTSDVLTLSFWPTTSTLGAFVTAGSNGEFYYDPTGVAVLDDLDTGKSLLDSFTYTVSDGNGGSDTATVYITVNGVTDDPTGVDDFYTTDEDTALTVPAATGALANDIPADPGDTLSFFWPTTSTLGAFITGGSDGNFYYDPTGVAALEALDTGESLVDSFTYTVFDQDGDSDTATVYITVNGVDETPSPPNAIYDFFDTDEDTPFDSGTVSVLDNDIPAQPGDTLTVVDYLATTASGGVIVMQPDGTFTYDPTGSATFQALNAGESILDGFTYTIEDQDGDSDTAWVYVTVTGVDDIL